MKIILFFLNSVYKSDVKDVFIEKKSELNLSSHFTP